LHPFDITKTKNEKFISAEKGAVVPECFGCCHGSDQARGVIASFVRRDFGRTSLRGVADPAGCYPWWSNARQLLC